VRPLLDVNSAYTDAVTTTRCSFPDIAHVRLEIGKLLRMG
jgi:hypothetical protein